MGYPPESERASEYINSVSLLGASLQELVKQLP